MVLPQGENFATLKNRLKCVVYFSLTSGGGFGRGDEAEDADADSQDELRRIYQDSKDKAQGA